MLNPAFIVVALALILILSFWIYIFVIFYHLVRFGIGTQPKVLSAMFVLGSMILFFICVFLFSGIDWNNVTFQIENFFTTSNFI